MNLLISLLLLAGSFLWADSDSTSLPVPPLINGSSVTLNIQNGSLQLPFGTSDTLGFNGNYLGPTIRFSRGDSANIQVNNGLNEDTTVHWHGLHVPAEYDGGPHQIVKAGESWNPEFRINQSAATLWYHPHLMGKTAEQVYRGLAGMFIIDDSYSDSLPIPRDYGVNDIPLILQDRRIDRSGKFSYQPSRPDVVHGYTGNIMLVNGAYQPVLDTYQGTYRFRILNGSNSSVYRLSFSDKIQFTVIASDGGFLPRSVSASTLIISPGERFEILADFRKNGDRTLNVEVLGGPAYTAMTVRTGSAAGRYFPHPRRFDYVHPDYSAPGLAMREFNMETRMMGSFTINGQQMRMDKINFSLKSGSEEIWTVRNVGMGMMNIVHSFHVHDTQFTVLSYNGRKPDPLYQGPKDTILLSPGDEAVIGVSFRDYTGVYMYHCHLLEHEDSGMMGQFLVE